MNDQDRQAIEQLFQKLQQVEGRTGPRDPEAEAFIRSRIAAQPGAPYYLAQTVIMQELALETANRRIEDLERAARQPAGGFLSGLFGGRPADAPQDRGTRRDGAAERGQAWNMRNQRGAGGGFLAGAAQTAMGVAGGVVLGNLLAGALFGGGDSGSSAATADAGTGNGGQDHAAADTGSDSDSGNDLGGDGFDTAGDFGDFGDFG